jgi:hypothetical protein
MNVDVLLLFIWSVSAEDESLRRMMGEGDIRKRKVTV